MEFTEYNREDVEYLENFKKHNIGVTFKFDHGGAVLRGNDLQSMTGCISEYYTDMLVDACDHKKYKTSKNKHVEAIFWVCVNNSYKYVSYLRNGNDVKAILAIRLVDERLADVVDRMYNTILHNIDVTRWQIKQQKKLVAATKEYAKKDFYFDKDAFLIGLYGYLIGLSLSRVPTDNIYKALYGYFMHTNAIGKRLPAAAPTISVQAICNCFWKHDEHLNAVVENAFSTLGINRPANEDVILSSGYSNAIRDSIESMLTSDFLAVLREDVKKVHIIRKAHE
jgi:hypothetical protein